MRIFIISLIPVAFSYAKSDQRNTITFSGGYARDVNAFCCQTDTAPSLGVTYGYCLFRNLQAEAGLITAIHPSPAVRGANYYVELDDRFYWVPFGIRGIVPLWSGRAEISAGAGAVWERYTANPYPAGGTGSRDGWGGYANIAGAVALDRKHHFWLGASPRLFFANTANGYRHDRWFIITGDLGFRF
jgi:hypothetical protein